MLDQTTSDQIFKDIMDNWLRCRANNIGKTFIAHSSKVNATSKQQLNGLLFNQCRHNGLSFFYLIMKLLRSLDWRHLPDRIWQIIIVNNMTNSLINSLRPYYESIRLVSLSKSTRLFKNTNNSFLVSVSVRCSDIKLAN